MFLMIHFAHFAILKYWNIKEKATLIYVALLRITFDILLKNSIILISAFNYVTLLHNHTAVPPKTAATATPFGITATLCPS